jgi:hypothetical protein
VREVASGTHFSISQPESAALGAPGPPRAIGPAHRHSIHARCNHKLFTGWLGEREPDKIEVVLKNVPQRFCGSHESGRIYVRAKLDPATDAIMELDELEVSIKDGLQSRSSASSWSFCVGESWGAIAGEARLRPLLHSTPSKRALSRGVESSGARDRAGAVPIWGEEETREEAPYR